MATINGFACRCIGVRSYASPHEWKMIRTLGGRTQRFSPVLAKCRWLGSVWFASMDEMPQSKARRVHDPAGGTFPLLVANETERTGQAVCDCLLTSGERVCVRPCGRGSGLVTGSVDRHGLSSTASEWVSKSVAKGRIARGLLTVPYHTKRSNSPHSKGGKGSPNHDARLKGDQTMIGIHNNNNDTDTTDDIVISGELSCSPAPSVVEYPPSFAATQSLDPQDKCLCSNSSSSSSSSRLAS
eukprot:jgi/Psemu1/69898/estExt_Genemark1.C_11390012